jgi:hypothetical protein
MCIFSIVGGWGVCELHAHPNPPLFIERILVCWSRRELCLLIYYTA